MTDNNDKTIRMVISATFETWLFLAIVLIAFAAALGEAVQLIPQACSVSTYGDSGRE